MTEKLNSTEAPEDHLPKVEGAIAEVLKAGAEGGPAAAAGAAAGADDNPVFNEGLSSAVGGSGASIFLTTAEEMRGPKKAGQSKSLFVGGQAHDPVPLVPMSYGEKKAAVKRGLKAAGKKAAETGGNVFERAQIAGQSLTGRVAGSKGAAPIKGAIKLTPEVLKSLRGVCDSLLDDLDHTKKTILNRYDSDDRLAAELIKGDERAEKLVASGQQSQRVDQLVKTRPVVFKNKNDKGPSSPSHSG